MSTRTRGFVTSVVMVGEPATFANYGATLLPADAAIGGFCHGIRFVHTIVDDVLRTASDHLAGRS